MPPALSWVRTRRKTLPGLMHTASWVGKLLAEGDPGAGNELLLGAMIVLEGPGWTDGRTSLVLEKAACLVLLPPSWRELRQWAKMKGSGCKPAEGQMSRDMKSSKNI